MQQSRQAMSSRLFAIIASFILMITMSFATTQTVFADDAQAVTGGDTITAGGEYQITAGATGMITVSTTEPVTLIGQGIQDAGKYSNLSVNATEAGTNLTIRDLYIDKVPGNEPMFDFTGQGNQFFFDGTSVLDLGVSGSSTGYAVLHVGPGTELTISGTDADDNLYIYKKDQAAGIGGNSPNNVGEANGTITFEQGNLFIKGSQQGAVIGSGAGSGKAAADPININGGTINLIGVARGAGIGGSAGSGGAAAGTTVNMNGGLVNINVDWSGAAIGGGGFDAGNDSDGGQIVYKAGSIRTFIDTNAVSRWSAKGVTEAGVNNNIAITADVVNADGEDLALLPLDTSLVDAADTYTVTEGDAVLYSGPLHKYAYVNEDLEKYVDGGQQAVTSTPTNWIAELEDPNLYLYATEEDHSIEVNGVKLIALWDDETGFTVKKEYPWDSATWAGGLDFSWYDENDVKAEYHITTPAQWAALAWICSEDLAKLADFETNTNGNVIDIKGTVPTKQNVFEGVKFYLDNDIDMGGVEAEDGTWSGPNYYPVGSQAQNDTKNGQFYGLFYGSFDGQGHYVNNIYCERGTDQSSQSTGLFGRVGAADGTVYPNVDITIENVGVTGFIKSGRSVGGIVGKTLHVASGKTITIQNCVNKATVRSTQKKGVGGICGAFWNAPVMNNCYSLGTAGGGTPAGSIVGGNEGTITNVYSTQKLAVAGEKATSSASVTNGYALGIDGVTEEYMKGQAFAEAMGEGFAVNCGGYPVLVWEGGKAHTPADAVEESIDPTYSKAGSVDSVVYCSECGAEISRERIETVDSLKDQADAALAAAEEALAAAEAATGEEAAELAETAADLAEAAKEAAEAALEAAKAEGDADAIAEATAALDKADQVNDAAVVEEAEAIYAAEAAIDSKNAAASALASIQAAVEIDKYNGQTAAEYQVAVAALKALINDKTATASQLKKALLEVSQAYVNLTEKADNTLSAAAKAKTVKAKKLKKKAMTVSGAVTVKDAVGTVTYAKAAGSAKQLSVNAKNGKITVKKKTKKGTYKIKVKVNASGNDDFFAGSKTVTVKIKVK